MRRFVSRLKILLVVVFVVSCIFAPTNVFAQEDGVTAQQVPPAPELVTRIVPLRHGDPDEVAQLLGSMSARSVPSDNPRALVVTGTEKDVQAVEAAVAQLDVPPPPVRNVEVTLYLVVVSKDGSLNSVPACPPALDGVKVELMEQFGYTQFGLLESVLFRGREGEGLEASGLLPPLSEEDGGDANQANYKFMVEQIQVREAGDGPAMIALDSLVCGTDFTVGQTTPAPPPSTGQPVRPMRPFSRMETGIRASLDLKEGEVAVVGKASVSSGGQGIFVLLSARVLGE